MCRCIYGINYWKWIKRGSIWVQGNFTWMFDRYVVTHYRSCNILQCVRIPQRYHQQVLLFNFHLFANMISQCVLAFLLLVQPSLSTLSDIQRDLWLFFLWTSLFFFLFFFHNCKSSVMQFLIGFGSIRKWCFSLEQKAVHSFQAPKPWKPAIPSLAVLSYRRHYSDFSPERANVTINKLILTISQ